MTKNEIIETIKRNELESWKDLKAFEEIEEKEEWLYERKLAKCFTYYELMQELNLMPLPRY